MCLWNVDTSQQFFCHLLSIFCTKKRVAFFLRKLHVYMYSFFTLENKSDWYQICNGTLLFCNWGASLSNHTKYKVTESILSMSSKHWSVYSLLTIMYKIVHTVYLSLQDTPHTQYTEPYYRLTNINLQVYLMRTLSSILDFKLASIPCAFGSI